MHDAEPLYLLDISNQDVSRNRGKDRQTETHTHTHTQTEKVCRSHNLSPDCDDKKKIAVAYVTVWRSIVASLRNNF